MSGPEHRLAVYGTLAPGQPNHDVVSHLAGRWFPGTVRGRLLEDGWGAAMGYPGIVFDELDDVVEVWVLESRDLVEDWGRLDEFEGPGYRRTEVSVACDDGPVAAFIYALAPQASS